MFESLYSQDKWDLGATYPVARLSFGSCVVQSRAELDVHTRKQMRTTRERLGRSVDHKTDIAGEF